MRVARIAEVGENSHGKNNRCKIGLLRIPMSDKRSNAVAFPKVIPDYEIDAGDSSGFQKIFGNKFASGRNLRCNTSVPAKFWRSNV
jgi:hypothetical protein